MAKTLSGLHTDNLEYEIIEYIILGYSQSEIFGKIKLHYSKLKTSTITSCYNRCKKIISDRVSTDVMEVVDLHVKWYEQLYRKFDSLDCLSGKNIALKQKEKILGLLKEDKVIRIENNLNLTINGDPEYDVNKLTPFEQKRLQGYLKLVV